MNFQKSGNFSIQPARADTCLLVETQGKGRSQESGTKEIDPNKTHSEASGEGDRVKKAIQAR